MAEVGVSGSSLPGRHRTTVWSSKQPGFGVRHYRSGRRVYVVQAAMQGVTRTVTLCNANILSERAALDLARRILLRAQVDDDPAEARKRRRASPMFARFLETYWQRAAPTWKPSTRGTQDKYRRLYLDRAFAWLGIDEIGEEEVTRWFADITRRGSPGAVNRTLCILSALFNKAIAWDSRPAGTNPTRGIRRNRRRVLERHLSDAEVERLGTVLGEMREEALLHVAAIRLLLLTGCRRNEIVGLRWSEVRGRRLQLADSKTGPRTVWLGEEARAVLDSLPRRSGVEAVFQDKATGRPIDLAHAWKTMRKRAALDPCRIHDLRHSFASHAAARSETLPMIGKLLGHASIQSTARYAHLDDTTLIEAAEQVGAALLRMVGEPP